MDEDEEDKEDEDEDVVWPTNLVGLRISFAAFLLFFSENCEDKLFLIMSPPTRAVLKSSFLLDMLSYEIGSKFSIRKLVHEKIQKSRAFFY